MTQKNTQGKLTATHDLLDENGDMVVDVHWSEPGVLKRIALCWNFCKHFSNRELERPYTPIAKTLLKVGFDDSTLVIEGKPVVELVESSFDLHRLAACWNEHDALKSTIAQMLKALEGAEELPELKKQLHHLKNHSKAGFSEKERYFRRENIRHLSNKISEHESAITAAIKAGKP